VLFNANLEQAGPRLFFAVNPQGKPAALNLEEIDLAEYRQIADSERFEPAGLDSALLRPLGNELELPPQSCALWVGGDR
jgi:hypothetical protein